MRELTDNDRQRIEQFAKAHGESFKTGEWFENLRIESCKIGAEYATRYEREQQAKEQIEGDANALLLSKLLDLCDQCYHYMKYNPPDKTKMSYNSWEDILEKLKYYKTEYYDTNDWKVFNEKLNSLKTK